VLPLTLDAALNLLWVAISLMALLWFARMERDRRRHGAVHGRFRRLFAVCMMAVALFPSVSDSDDLFNFSLLRIPTSHPGSVGSIPSPPDSREKDTIHLARLLETLEHFQVTGFYTFALALFCVAASISLRPAFYSRVIRCNSGRAPPLL
jgi:hypothetical protein